MTNPHLILGNGASDDARRPAEWASVEPQHLATFGPRTNVTLKITDLTDRMAARLPPTVQDLVELAALVYAADQSSQRIGRSTIDWGDQWHRTFRFEVMVREPTFWNQEEVKQALVETLGFLSGDNYEFEFRKLVKVPLFTDYLEFNQAAGLPEPVERVTLFSGGLDSLAGAVQDVLVHRRRVAMVSHKPVDHLAVKQRRLVTEIARRAAGPHLAPLHFPVKANKAGTLSVDYTQRSRSFLYASMAAAVAHYFSLSAIHFYENGVVSVNLPLCQQEVGTRATRTTHPQVLAGFGRIFSLVTGRKGFAVHNEFVWQTKQDMLEQLRRTPHVDLAQESLSCTHTRGFTLASPHCGLCSQCMSRRVASLGAEYDENDPATGYRHDVLLAPRTKDDSRILAERFVGTARQIEDMESLDQFHESYAGELGRVAPYLGIPTKIAVERLFDLHKRHAVQVGQVLSKAMTAHADDRRRGRLDSTCMLNYAFDAGQPKPPATPAGTSGATPEAEIVVCTGRIRLGKPGAPSTVDGKPKKALTDGQHAVVRALIGAGEAGLSKDAIEHVRPSARQILKTLSRDPDWGRVIVWPGQTNGRYRVL